MYKYIKKKLQNGKTMDEHRYIWKTMVGEIPKGYDVHHINEDGKDNRLENLILVTRSEHMKIHMDKGRICDIKDCGLPHFGKGFCKKHYKRFWKTGNPLWLKGHSSSNPKCIP